MAGFREKYWLFIAAFLALSLITGIVFLSIKLAGQQPMEISLSDAKQPDVNGEIYIGGAVYRPGIYPVKRDDTLSSCIEAAGPTGDADLTKVKILVSAKTETASPQKIDLNRAEPWLLQALPGIGEGRARAIIEYRGKNGLYRNVDDLLKVEGFGKSTLDKIKDYVTVGD
jgi:competence protein ComEA